MTETILDLKKSRVLVERMYNGAEITKDAIWNDQVKNFKMAKIQVVKDEIRRQNPTLIDVDETVLSSGKKKTSKEKKKTTYEKTLELFEKGWSPEEIAERRNVTDKTIYRHLAKLIQDEKVEVEEVLDQKVLGQLREIFGNEIEGSLTEAKEKAGNKISWEELKIYHASLLR